MLQTFGNLFGGKPQPKSGPWVPEFPTSALTSAANAHDRRPTFSKVFRWRLPDGQTQGPASVEIAGTFTNWQRVPLMRDGVLDAWHVTLHHIQGHRTHHYMLLVDGKPVYDKNCDGVAVPRNPQEEQYQLLTDKGPRVFMLFAQTK